MAGAAGGCRHDHAVAHKRTDGFAVDRQLQGGDSRGGPPSEHNVVEGAFFADEVVLLKNAEALSETTEQPLLFRNPKTAKQLSS